MFDTMTDTLALFIGLYMLAAGIGLLTDPTLYAGAIDALRKNPMLTYLAAILAFTVGAVIVALHNVWNSPAAALVSLIGWSALIEGAAMLAFQRPALRLIARIPMTRAVMMPFGIATVMIGVWLVASALV